MEKTYFVWVTNVMGAWESKAETPQSAIEKILLKIERMGEGKYSKDDVSHIVEAGSVDFKPITDI